MSHELVLLSEACRTVDDLDRLRSALAHAESVVPGSQGQQIPNRLFGEIRQHSELLSKTLAGLRLPQDDEDAGISPAARRAQNAAQTRWRQAERTGKAATHGTST